MRNKKEVSMRKRNLIFTSLRMLSLSVLVLVVNAGWDANFNQGKFQTEKFITNLIQL